MAGSVGSLPCRVSGWEGPRFLYLLGFKRPLLALCQGREERTEHVYNKLVRYPAVRLTAEGAQVPRVCHSGFLQAYSFVWWWWYCFKFFSSPTPPWILAFQV